MTKHASYDLIVVGGTPAGCAAAIAGARKGLVVLLLEPTPALGGMNSNGIGMGDFVHRSAVGGIYAEFLAEIEAHYTAEQPADALYSGGHRANVYFEPGVSASVWRRLVGRERDITLLTGAVVVDVIVERGRVAGVRWQPARTPFGDPDGASSAQESRAAVVIDATYEGDVAAWAGVPFRLGREARSPLEPHAGLIYTNYVSRAGVGGLPPDSILPGSTGEADDRIMAFNCRLVMKWYASRDGAHRVLNPPSGYDPAKYRWTDAMRRRDFGSGGIRMPHGKLYLNVPFLGNDLVGPNREYVLAHPRDRADLRRAFVDHALGFLYFIQNEGGSPELGLSDEEFTDNNNLPYQIYIREGRRIRGVAEMTEQDVTRYLAGDPYRPPLKRDSVAVGDFEVDVKICQDEADGISDYAEGAIFLRALRAPFQIPFGCIVPDQVEGLLVPVAVSATHVAYAATRLEPAWAALGQAAGTAAAQLEDARQSVRDIDVGRLQAQLLADRCVLTQFTDVSPGHRAFVPVQRVALHGYVPPDSSWRFRPEDPITWGELLSLVATAWKVPPSVTGLHFDGLDFDSSALLDAESILDLTSRVGLNPFPHSLRNDDDPHVVFHQSRPTTVPLRLDPAGIAALGDAVSFIEVCAQALGRALPPGVQSSEGFLARGEAARLVAEAL